MTWYDLKETVSCKCTHAYRETPRIVSCERKREKKKEWVTSLGMTLVRMIDINGRLNSWSVILLHLQWDSYRHQPSPSLYKERPHFPYSCYLLDTGEGGTGTGLLRRIKETIVSGAVVLVGIQYVFLSHDILQLKSSSLGWSSGVGRVALKC